MPQRRRRAPLPKDWHRTRRVILERGMICQLQTHCPGSPAEDAHHIDDREIIPPRTSGGVCRDLPQTPNSTTSSRSETTPVQPPQTIRAAPGGG